MKTSSPDINDEVLTAYHNEIIHVQRIILSLPTIDPSFKSMHEFMVDQFNGWLIKIENLEAAPVKRVVRKRAARKRTAKKVVNTIPLSPALPKKP